MGCVVSKKPIKHLKFKPSNDEKPTPSMENCADTASLPKSPNLAIIKKISLSGGTFNSIEYEPNVVESSVLEVKEENDKFEVTVPAGKSEYLCPIWVEEGEKIMLEVSGNWSFLQGMSCNYSGYTDFDSTNAFPIGSLLFRAAARKPIKLKSKNSLKFVEPGYFYLYGNIGDYDCTASGALTVRIKGGNLKSIREMEESQGWLYAKLATADSAEELTSEEKMQIYLINKLRMSPKLFAKEYLYHRKKESAVMKELIDKLEMMAPLPVLEHNRMLSQIAAVHSEQIGKKGTTKKTVEDKRGLSAQANICFFKWDALGIVLSLLIDDGCYAKENRMKLLSGEFTKIGVATRTHFAYQNCCVQVFSR